MSFALGGTPIGSHQKPDVNQFEQSATTTTVRQNTMLVKDTLEVPFTKMQGDIYKYTSSENKPMLPMYLQVFLSKGERQEQTWLQAFKELANKLPSDIKAFLKQELQKPPGQRDPNMEGLKKSLEFAAKGLDFLRDCKNVDIKINDEERKKIEGAEAKESLDFYRRVLQATNAVAKSLSPLRIEREFLFQMSSKIPKVISAIGSKREKENRGMELTSGDHVILQEIEELKAHLDKNLGEKRPVIASFLVDHLEVLHQLSFPSLNKRLFRMLWTHYQFMGVEFSWMARMLGSLIHLSAGIADRTSQNVLIKESTVFIGELLLMFLSLLDRSEKKKEFSFFLGLSILISSSLLKTIGEELAKGLLMKESDRQWLQQAILGASSGMLYVMTKQKKLHEKESAEFFAIFKDVFLTSLTSTLAFLEKREGDVELKVICMKFLSLVEAEDQEELVSEAVKALGRVGIFTEDLEKTVKELQLLTQTIQEELVESEKEGQKMVLSARSA